MRLQGRGILITGASLGLGKAIASACVDEGAHVFLCARGAEALEKTRAELLSRARPGQKVAAMAADVSRPEEAARLMESALAALPAFHGLVNNAGIYGPQGLLEETDWQDWVRTIETNLYGTAFLCRAAIPVMRKLGYGKIVNLSGGGASGPLPRFSAYAASKGAIVHLTETLAHELKGSGIDVNALAPGPLNTRLLDQVLAAGPQKLGSDIYDKALKQKKDGGAPPEKGAALCAYLLSGASDGITGRLLSAMWDGWETLADHRADVAAGDIYTLRRVVPKDRGLGWS
jgi:NAD(P)-dependent dehydrogenase (short-subunit alcohol dehydrogenase family)